MKTFFQRADIFLLVMCIICSLFGIAAIHKAVTGMAVGGWSGMENPTKFIVVQVFSMFLGIGIYLHALSQAPRPWNIRQRVEQCRAHKGRFHSPR